jgi:hypothetical protein
VVQSGSELRWSLLHSTVWNHWPCCGRYWTSCRQWKGYWVKPMTEKELKFGHVRRRGTIEFLSLGKINIILKIINSIYLNIEELT